MTKKIEGLKRRYCKDTIDRLNIKDIGMKYALKDNGMWNLNAEIKVKES